VASDGGEALAAEGRCVDAYGVSIETVPYDFSAADHAAYTAD
jgi:uncharacterized protein GlcG (DUF336 family)